jgi:alpha-L-fucosidase 2
MTGNELTDDMIDANINLQMNYWSAFHTNMDVQKPLFDYIQDTWAPRGAQTAQLIYNVSRGWVTHNEMDVSGLCLSSLLGNANG